MKLNLLSSLRDRLRRRAYRIHGPVPAAELDEYYQTGKWDYLEGASELGRFAVVAGYVTKLRPGGRILDAGGGRGHLRSFFHDSSFRDYVCSDLSPLSLQEGASRGYPNTTFVVADLNEGPPEGRYDVAILSECLQYAADPAEVFRRHWRSVEPGGLLIISLFEGSLRSAEIWKAVNGVEAFAHSTRVSNERELSWNIRVFLKP